LAGTKRERELARAKYERQQARRHAETARRRRRTQVVSAIVVAVLVVVGVVALSKVMSSGSADETAAGATPTPSSLPSPSPIPTDGSDATCTYLPVGAAVTGNRQATPPAEQQPTRPATSTAVLTLNGQKVTVQLLNSKAPCTVGSFTALAKQKYFDKTPCHRLTTGSLAVLQCGDPTGTGSGGPGYQFNDENLAGATYKAGTVAMANSGADTNGSQFFLVYADSQLDPNYTPFGTIVGGLDVLKAIAAKGVKGGGSDGAPAQPVTLNSVTTSG
jgi:peptidyl-prolyl cis-trans isomerase B (cyclophilin B)